MMIALTICAIFLPSRFYFLSPFFLLFFLKTLAFAFEHISTTRSYFSNVKKYLKLEQSPTISPLNFPFGAFLKCYRNN